MLASQCSSVPVHNEPTVHACSEMQLYTCYVTSMVYKVMSVSANLLDVRKQCSRSYSAFISSTLM